MDALEQDRNCRCVSEIRNLVQRNCNNDFQGSFVRRTVMARLEAGQKCGCPRKPFRCYRSKSPHFQAVAPDSGTSTFKGHRNSSPLVLEVWLQLQPASSVFEEKKNKLMWKWICTRLSSSSYQLILGNNRSVRLKPLPSSYLVYYMESYKSCCHFDTEDTFQGISLILFSFRLFAAHMFEREPTMDTVHRSVISSDRGARMLSEGWQKRRCAFSIAYFRIGKTPVSP
ncbi:hypothetical protein TNCV_469001 [Trichonephila clavipes]|nr:hypothetical protein TNCV_469001 [Trichonephila clavipes]